MMESNGRWDWRGPIVGAVAMTLLGAAGGWLARPTIETAQSAVSAAKQEASEDTQIRGLSAQVSVLADKIDKLTERTFGAETHAEMAAERADINRHFDALEARFNQLEQELRQASPGRH